MVLGLGDGAGGGEGGGVGGRGDGWKMCIHMLYMLNMTVNQHSTPIDPCYSYDVAREIERET